MMRERKCWGERWLIRADSTHATSILKLDKGFQCSWHRHQAKYNLFVVLRGKVGIVTEQFGGLLPMTVLSAGEMFTTKPGEWHKFVVMEDSEMLEEMYVEYSEADIERKELGGKIKLASGAFVPTPGVGKMKEPGVVFLKDENRPKVPIPPSPPGSNNPDCSKYGDI